MLLTFINRKGNTMKKFTISVIIGFLILISATVSIFAAEITLVSPGSEEIEIAPGRDFYVVGKINREGKSASSYPLNVKIELLNSKGEVVRSLTSRVAPDGITSAQYFMTDYDMGSAIEDPKGVNIIQYASPDIMFDGYDRDSIRYPYSKILVKDDYFAAVIYGGNTKGFDLLYQDDSENTLTDITAGRYILVVTALNKDNEEVARYQQILNFGNSSERIIACDDNAVREYAKSNNITLNNSIVGKWTPYNYINKANGFSYIIPMRYVTNVISEYGNGSTVNILINNIHTSDTDMNLKLGSVFASKSPKNYLYYNIGDKEVSFDFNGTSLKNIGEIVNHGSQNFVKVLRSETIDGINTYADFNSRDGFVLTEGKSSSFYGVFSPIVKTSVLSGTTYKITDEAAYVKVLITDKNGKTLYEEYVNPYMLKKDSKTASRYEFTFSVTPSNSLVGKEGCMMYAILCDSEKKELLSGDAIPIIVNNEGSFIGNYDESYWGKAFCDTINALGETPSGVTLNPDEHITRGDFAAMINRIYGYSVMQKATFSDLDENSIYYADCATAQTVGYMTGDEKGRVAAEDYISREQAMIILARISKAEPTDKIITFKDNDSISFWAKDYVDVMSSNGIVTGYDGYLNPQNRITVAEAAALIIKTFKWIYSPDAENTDAITDSSDSLSDAEISDTDFIGEITFESLYEFYSKNSVALSSIASYIQRNCPNGVYINKVGNGLEIRDYALGNYVTLSDDALNLITALSGKFAEFSIRYNPASEVAVHFVLGRDENGKTQGLTFTALEQVKNKELTNIDGNWFYFIQR